MQSLTELTVSIRVFETSADTFQYRYQNICWHLLQMDMFFYKIYFLFNKRSQSSQMLSKHQQLYKNFAVYQVSFSVCLIYLFFLTLIDFFWNLTYRI